MAASGLQRLPYGVWSSLEIRSPFHAVHAPPSSQEIALYGAVCALASFDRQALKDKVINSIAFREVLEAVPEVR